ncbi:hypothetical protein [Caldithrix abyssi]
MNMEVFQGSKAATKTNRNVRKVKIKPIIQHVSKKLIMPARRMGMSF